MANLVMSRLPVNNVMVDKMLSVYPVSDRSTTHYAARQKSEQSLFEGEGRTAALVLRPLVEYSFLHFPELITQDLNRINSLR